MTTKGRARGVRACCLVAATMVSLGTGCSRGAKSGTDTPAQTEAGDGTLATITPVATAGAAFRTAFDAVPNAAADTIFFTAGNADSAGVFSVPAGGGTPTALSTGGGLVLPLAIEISGDGATLFVADPAAEGPSEGGGIFTLPTAGGTPSRMRGADGFRPGGLALSPGGDTLFFTGRDPADGKAGVFTMPTAGGTVTPFSKPAELQDPQGLAISNDGATVYVVDSVSGGTGGRLLGVTSGGASVLAQSLATGLPGGIALAQDGSAVLLTTTTAGATSVTRIHLGDGATTTFSGGLEKFAEPAGLHRARSANSYALVDSGANGTGAVFLAK